LIVEAFALIVAAKRLRDSDAIVGLLPQAAQAAIRDLLTADLPPSSALDRLAELREQELGSWREAAAVELGVAAAQVPPPIRRWCYHKLAMHNYGTEDY
jgi:hypothetical protein